MQAEWARQRSSSPSPRRVSYAVPSAFPRTHWLSCGRGAWIVDAGYAPFSEQRYDNHGWTAILLSLSGSRCGARAIRLLRRIDMKNETRDDVFLKPLAATQ